MHPDLILAFLRTARGHGLNLTQLLTMTALRANGPMNMTAIGRITRLSTAAMTCAADSLETSGLAMRQPTADRRMINLALTDAGHDAIAIILSTLEPIPA